MRDTWRHIMPRKARKKVTRTAESGRAPQRRGVTGNHSGAQRWRELARDFEVAVVQYRATNVYLVYFEPYDDDEGGFWLQLQHPDPMEDHEDSSAVRLMFRLVLHHLNKPTNCLEVRER